MKSILGPSPKLSVQWGGQADRASVQTSDGSTLYLFKSSDIVEGTVTVSLPPKASKFDHTGITAELIGQVQLNYDRGNHYVFLSMARELAPAGSLRENKKIQFSFDGTEKN